MNELKILYHDEIQIIGWGESRPRGKYLVIRLSDTEDEDPLEPFRGLDSRKDDKSAHILNATISIGDILPEQKEEENWGKLASRLYANGFFIAPPVLKQLGTDKQFREWIQTRPSAISGEFSESVNGEGRCEAAHVRRAGEAGTGYKPEYACIPLTHTEHHIQHTQGESALKPREWFDKMRIEYVTNWARFSLLDQLSAKTGEQYEGFREVPPKVLRQWCLEHGLTPYLPKEYHQ